MEEKDVRVLLREGGSDDTRRGGGEGKGERTEAGDGGGGGSGRSPVGSNRFGLRPTRPRRAKNRSPHSHTVSASPQQPQAQAKAREHDEP